MFVTNKGDVIMSLHHGNKICGSQQKEVLQINSEKKPLKMDMYDFAVHDR